MLHTLRGRLLLSHVLPLLVITPLTGLALIYVLETRILLSNLAGELRTEAFLVSQDASGQPQLWQDPARAQSFVTRLSHGLTARITLIDASGRLLATTDVDGNELRPGQLVNDPDVVRALGGQTVSRTATSDDLSAEVADVLVPAIGSDGQILGVVRLTHRLGTVYDLFLRLRSLITAILLVGVVLGGGIGLALAVNLNRSIDQVTRSVVAMAAGQQIQTVPERGAEEIRALARAFNGLQERLRTLEGTRRQMLANLVHELARPLGALMSANEALRQGAVDDPILREELLSGMGSELSRLRGHLDNLAQLHDRVLGAPELIRSRVQLGAWLRSTVAPWRPAAEEKGLAWQAAIDDRLLEAEIDPDRMAQALGNLLSNAIKYTPSGGAVSVVTGVDGSEAWIRVDDTGPGIDPEEQPRVFAPFYRGPQSRRFPQGMGLGLTISRDIVAAHGGRLELESNLGKGSRFTIRFPLEPR